jgi:rubrerythrin
MRIRRLVERIDEQHREAMRTIEQDLGEVHFGARGAAVADSRRRFVRNLGLGGVLAAGAATAPTLAFASAAAAQSAGGTSGGDVELPEADLLIVDFAVSLELAAEEAYGLAIARRIFDSQVAEMGRTFARHHHDHAIALATLAGRDEETVGQPNAGLVDELAPRLDAATTTDELLQVLYDVEEGAAATYAEAIGTLESTDAVGPASSILPVESQHATAIGSMLDLPVEDWMPPFQTTADAFDPSTYAG